MTTGAKSWNKLPLTIFLLPHLVAPGVALANGMKLASQDSFATARGEAFAATADNASAVYYNPAGLTQIPGDELRGGLYGLYFDPTFKPPASAPNAGKTYHIDQNFAGTAQGFYSHQFGDSPWRFGAGMYSPYGAAVEWPNDTGFYSVATYGRVTYFRFNGVLACEVAPGLSLAAGVMIDYADIALEQGLLRRAQPFDNSFRFSGDGWSAGANAGILWQPHEKISLGATVRSPTTINFEGETKFEQQPIIQPTRLKAEAEFEFPLTVVCGVSFRPTTNWNIEFNADYTDWNSFDSVTIKQQGTPPFPVQQNIPVTLDWESSWMFSFGATRRLGENWHASAGYAFNQNSVPDSFYSPLAADLDRHFFTIGCGRKGKRWDFDIAYQFGYGPAHTVSGSQPSSQPGLFAGQNADGTYEFISHAIMVTIGLRF